MKTILGTSAMTIRYCSPIMRTEVESKFSKFGKGAARRLNRSSRKVKYSFHKLKKDSINRIKYENKMENIKNSFILVTSLIGGIYLMTSFLF